MRASKEEFMSDLFPIIYLTGAPATGKSTLSRNMAARVPDLIVFTYSEELRRVLARDNAAGQLTEDSIRELSAKVVTAEHVAQLDRELIARADESRKRAPFLIDSHPVTKEDFGFRVTAFSMETLKALSPDIVLCLYTEPDVVIERIARDAMGRPTVTEFEAAMHTQLQTGIAAQYGVLTGKAVYFLDSSVGTDELADLAITKAGLAASRAAPTAR
jgi:adenylate kinase